MSKKSALKSVSKAKQDPAWPKLRRKKGLTVEDLSGDRSVLVIDNVLSAEECEAIISVAEARGMSSTYAPPRKGYAYRDNERVLLNDPNFANELWVNLLKDLVSDVLVVNGKVPARLNDDLRIYRYKTKQRFGPHIDENVRQGQHMSEYTVLLYLNGGEESGVRSLKGGETVFHSKPQLSVCPKMGRVCIHWQQHNCLHEGAIVTSGEKWVLRTDILY